MKGSGKPKANRTFVSQNTGAMNSKNNSNQKYKNQQNKKALIDKFLNIGKESK